jgi:hypothetical protein
MKKITKTLMLMFMMAMLFAVGAYASGEPSDEASAEPVAQQTEQATSKTTIIYGGQTYVLDVYEIDGVEYVKLADASALLEDNDIYDLAQDVVSGEPAAEASGEPSGEIEAEASGEPSGEIEAEASDEPSGEIEAEASGEPSGEPAAEASGEPSGEVAAEASGEPSGEPAAALEEQSFDVTFRINGVEYQTASVGVAVQEDTYTFQISALLDILGLELTYDEQSDVAYLSAQSDGLLAALMGQALAVEQEAAGVPEDAEPVQEQEETAAVEDAVPATGGTENQQNVLASTAAPETEEQFEAYKAYLTDFMTGYTGTGDGTFDDGARDMALGELSGVGFGADVSAFPFEMFVSQFGALDYGTFIQTTG